MRILNAGHHHHVQGGSDRAMLRLGELLEARGHTVVPFASQHPENRPSKWDDYFPPGVDTQAPSPSDAARFVYSPEARWQMGRLLEDGGPFDLAHLHIYYGQLTASILKPLVEAEVPTVQTLHEYKLTCPVHSHLSQGEICEACAGHAFWRALPRRCNEGSLARTALSVLEASVSRALGDAHRIDHFIAVSDFLREKMIEHDVADPDDITTVHNFVDPDRFEPSRRRGEHVLYFGRIAPEKGLRTLIDAAAPLTDLPVRIAGTGEQRAALEAEVARRILDHFEFVGVRNGADLWDLVRGSICTLLPSEWYENCPMAVLESLACARPVIGADIGGIPELVDDSVDGRLFPSGDVEALREALVWMQEHRDEAMEMGRRGREKVEERFSPEQHYRQVREVYAEVL
ncbi:glycosyltransferase involved in cell wall biosynthesis [Salinibacter ruber]|uniref:glycosyltransferase family 4 protein n=1 Tax=Salinibacter ruber TaxID=146919 RepID=UPI00216A3A8B|nr:glycosyltransferase family 4 protein [Salinibacter ruber]MCS3628259.1 glycosyltransferase involved in cell wall biosynthesis [Salinibacter ruber]MCS4145168.1 glycosyltransferase involved in cell wall biosynthesis [Salinibacter ruber]